MRQLFVMMMMAVAVLSAQAQDRVDSLKTDSTPHRVRVALETSKGNIVVELYDETPRHRDNFIKLVNEGYYNGILWHRVIADFMIQTGDSTTRHARPGEPVGGYSPDYTLPAEIVFPQFFHKRGALAAAREGDASNPERASSSSQFYIVYGWVQTPSSLDKAEQRIEKATEGRAKLTPDLRDYYMKRGGSPHLDGQYTVFGQVVEGLDVVRDIDFVDTDDHDRPLEDVRIVKATVLGRQ